MPEILLIGFLLVAGCSLLALAREPWLINPAALFILMQVLLFTGTYAVMDRNNSVDVVYLSVSLLCLCTFVCGAFIANSAGRHGSSKRRRHWWSRPVEVDKDEVFDVTLIALIIISVVVGVTYYYLLGYNLFLRSIRELMSGGELIRDEVTTLRLAAYSGDRYLAPGYVNQFKNYLLPALVGFLYVRSVLLGARRQRLVALGVAPVAIVLLLGTGQRGALVYISAILYVFSQSVLPKHEARWITIVGVASVLCLFVSSTLILGRSVTSLESAADIGRLVVDGVWKRVFQTSQYDGLLGFRHIYDMPIQYGKEWMAGIYGIFPGRSGSSLSHELHELIYGTYRGTAPISIWGSIWYNFGVVGIVVIPFAMGIVYQYVYIRLISGRRSLFRVLLYASATVLLATWKSGGPAAMINKGLGTVVALGTAYAVWNHIKPRISGRRMPGAAMTGGIGARVDSPRRVAAVDWTERQGAGYDESVSRG